MSTRRLGGLLPVLAGVFTAATVLLVVYFLDLAGHAYEHQRGHIESAEELAVVRARLESELNTSIFLTHGLAAYVASNPDISSPQFDRLAHELLQRSAHVRHLALAPDNVITRVHPLAGNEPIVGLDLTTLPEQRAAVERAMRLGGLVLTGPIDMVQGGRGLATREPVYTVVDGERRYWGLVTALVRIDTLIEKAGLDDPALSLRVAVRSLEAGRPVLYGAEALFERAELRHVVELPGTEWEIVGEPKQYASMINHGASRALGILLAVMAGGLVWRLQTQGAAMRASERKYRAFIEKLNDGVCIAQDGVIRFANPRVESITGYPLHQLMGMPIEMLMENDEDRQVLLERHAERMQGIDGPNEYEMRIRRYDGQLAYVRLNTALVKWEGRPAALGTVTDITERRELEAALRESRNRLSAMVHAMPDIAFILDEDGYYLDVFGGGNPAMYSPAQGLVGKTLHQALPADVADRFLDCIRRVIRTGQLETVEYQLTVSDVNTTPDVAPFGTQWFEGRVAPLNAYSAGSPAVLWLAFNITQHKQTERELRQREAAFQALVENSPDIISRIDRNLRFVYVNSAVERYSGITPQERIGRTSAEVGLDPAMASLWEGHFRRAFDEGRIQMFEFRMTSLQGNDLYFESRVIPEFGDDGVDTLLVIDHEITERKRNENQLRLAASVFHNTGEAMLVADANRRVVRCNPAYIRLTGLGPGAVVGKPCPHLQHPHAPELSGDPQRDSMGIDGHWEGEITAARADGDVFPAWMTVNAVRNEQGVISHYLVTIADISSRKRWEQQLRHEATHDPLTSLPNRTLLLDRLTVALAQARRNDTELAVLFVDLDEFKPVNDELGHRSGDMVLRELAYRMRQTVRETDTVARIGGDEFVVLIPGPTDIRSITAIAEILLAAIPTPIEIHGHTCSVGASIGISRFPQDAGDSDGLLAAADNAMYAAKAAGRGCYMFYSGKQLPLSGPDA